MCVCGIALSLAWWLPRTSTARPGWRFGLAGGLDAGILCWPRAMPRRPPGPTLSGARRAKTVSESQRVRVGRVCVCTYLPTLPIHAGLPNGCTRLSSCFTSSTRHTRLLQMPLACIYREQTVVAQRSCEARSSHLVFPLYTLKSFFLSRVSSGESRLGDLEPLRASRFVAAILASPHGCLTTGNHPHQNLCWIPSINQRPCPGSGWTLSSV